MCILRGMHHHHHCPIFFAFAQSERDQGRRRCTKKVTPPPPSQPRCGSVGNGEITRFERGQFCTAAFAGKCTPFNFPTFLGGTGNSVLSGCAAYYRCTECGADFELLTKFPTPEGKVWVGETNGCRQLSSPSNEAWTEGTRRRRRRRRQSSGVSIESEEGENQWFAGGGGWVYLSNYLSRYFGGGVLGALIGHPVCHNKHARGGGDLEKGGILPKKEWRGGDGGQSRQKKWPICPLWGRGRRGQKCQIVEEGDCMRGAQL